MAERFEVLLVDPDEPQRQLIDLLLSDARLRLTEVPTARAALERLRTHTPDLLVIAAELPDLDGVALTARVKRVARLASVPVIVTAEPDGDLGVSPELRSAAERAGVDLLLPRPLGDKNLKERALRLVMRQATSGAAPVAEASPSAAPGLRSTVALDEALADLARQDAGSGAYGGPGGLEGAKGTASGTNQGAGGSPARAHLERAEREALLRENEALRRENHALQSTIDQLKRQLNEARRVGRPRRD